MTDQVPGNPAPQPTGQDGNNQPPAPTNSVPWLPGADELTVGYVQNKGWKDPAQVLDSYRNLEKVFGADKAGNTVVLPKPDAAQADLDAFYTRLGRPASADGYKLPLPEGTDPAFSKIASQWFFEHGVPAKAAEGIVTKLNEWTKAQNDAAVAASNAAYEKEDLALHQKWGAAFDQNVEQARAFVRGMGLDADTIEQLSQVMGHQKTMEFFQTLGAKMGEHDFVASHGQAKFGDAMTPAQAKAKMEILRADKAWTAKYLSGDAEAKAEMDRLHRYAFPEEK